MGTDGTSAFKGYGASEEGDEVGVSMLWVLERVVSKLERSSRQQDGGL